MNTDENARRPGEDSAGARMELSAQEYYAAPQRANDLLLLAEAARPLKVHRNELLTWTLERIERESSETLRLLEGVREVADRSIDALTAVRLRIRRAPEGSHYVRDLLGEGGE
jgi:hypothetical protein